MERKLLKKVGNFKVLEVERKGMPYVIITTVNEDWKLEHRGDCAMFMAVRLLVDMDKELLNFCTLMFVMTYTMHTAETYQVLMKSVMDELDKVGTPAVSEADDKKMLEDTVQMEELAEKIAENG